MRRLARSLHIPRALAAGLLTFPTAATAAGLPFGPPEGTHVWASAPDRLGEAFLLTVALAGLVALIAAPLTWRGVRRALGDPGIGETFALLGLTVAALLVRTLVAQPAAILSSFNGIHHAHDVMCLAGQASACDLSPGYPLGVKVLHALVLRVTGPSVIAIYWTNAILGAVTVPILWAFGVLVTQKRAVGWLAAVALAALPLHIRFSASGALVTGLIFYWTLAITALAFAARGGTPRHIVIAGLAGALGVASRFEGPAYIVLLLLTGGFVAPGLRHHLRRPAIRNALVFSALLLAAACVTPIREVLQPYENAGMGGLTRLSWKLAVALGIPLATLGLAVTLDRLRVPHGWRWALGGAVVVAAVVLAPPQLTAWDALFAPDAGLTFAGEGLWWPTYAVHAPPLLNPRAVPLPFLLLGAVGVVGGLASAHRGLVVLAITWLGVTAALASQKFTGALPFEHLRTAVSASPAVALLAGLGAAHLVAWIPARRATAAVVTLALAAGPALSLPMLTDRGFNNERQILFLRDALPRVPSGAVVIYPSRPSPPPTDGTFPPRPPGQLFRVSEVWWTIGRESGVRGDRFLPADAALAAPDAIDRLRNAGVPLLFWEPLTCWRTGERDTRRPDCDDMHDTFVLEPIERVSFRDRPFESDFWVRYLVVREDVPLTIYEVVGVR